MKQRQIGKTGPKISAIGIGAMSFTNFYGETSENQSHDILKTALDYGVSHIAVSYTHLTLPTIE